MTQVVMLNLFYEAGFETPSELLAHYVNLTHWVEGLAMAGATVTVFQRFSQHATLEAGSVTYHFVADGYGPQVRGGQQPWAMYRRVAALCRANKQAGLATVVHLNGLLFPLHAWLLGRFLPPECPLLIQHHAEQPWPKLTRRLQGWGLRAAAGFMFTTRALAEPWLSEGLIGSMSQVYELVETSSPFRFEPRDEARARTGLQGEPVVLWTGSLSPRKDPLTVLAGFEQALTVWPEMRLYMAYLEQDLLAEVQARLASRPKLAQAVTLLGRIPHAEIAVYYNSADIFVQGSQREGSGIALLDALACGVVPVVTDIPPFRVITDDGRIGALWPVGQAEAFAQALLQVLQQPLAAQSKTARDFFAGQLSFSALGRKALSIYQQVLAKNK